MKQFILIVLSVSFLMACRKDQAASIRIQFPGEWEYVRFSGCASSDQSMSAEWQHYPIR